MPVRYTVKQVSQLTGISTDLLRAWERRYAVVSPQRTASRYRLYGDDDVVRLRRMAELIAEGAPASLAAHQVIAENPPLGADAVPTDGTTDGLDATGPSANRTNGTNGSAPRPPVDEVPVPAPRFTTWTPHVLSGAALPPVSALTDAARDLDRAALEHTLDEVFAAGSFETIFDEWLTPALVQVGEAWASEDISVAGEHFVSAAVHRRLARAFDAAGNAVNAPVVAVGLPPRTMHELASLGFATCLRRRGVDVRYLGADLPVESWVSAVGRLSPDAVTVSVPRTDDSDVALELVRTLAEKHQGLRIYVGGRGCEGWGDAEPVTLLPGPVTRSAHELAVSLAS